MIPPQLSTIVRMPTTEKTDKYNPKKTFHNLTWLCLLLTCIGTSWFAYQVFLVPQPRTFTPDWHNGRWIEASDTSSDPSPVAYFRRSLYFSVIPNMASITITANQTFRLYVNGSYVSSNTQDLLRGRLPQAYIFDIDSMLVTGTNIIAIRVANADKGPGWGQAPSLLTNISARWGNQSYNYGTDETWQATGQAALAHPRMSKTDYDWTKLAFDATKWRGAQISSKPLTYPALMINPQIYELPMPISWISAGAGQESYYVRRFSTPAGYDNALLRIVATGQADIFINDHLYTRWSSLANAPQANVFTYLNSNDRPTSYRRGLMLGIYDITPYVHPGSNTIAVHVLAPGTATAKIGLDTQRGAISLEILAGSAGKYSNVVSSPMQWHASLKPTIGWTKEDGPALTWHSPELIGRPGSSRTFYLPNSNTTYNVQAVALGPLAEIIGMSIITVLTFWFFLSLALQHHFMPSRRDKAATTDRHCIDSTLCLSSPYETASLVFLPALALETLLVTLSHEFLITQPFPYTGQWGLVLIAVVILTALLLYFHSVAIGIRQAYRDSARLLSRDKPQPLHVLIAPVRKHIGGTLQPIWSASANGQSGQETKPSKAEKPYVGIMPCAAPGSSSLLRAIISTIQQALVSTIQLVRRWLKHHWGIVPIVLIAMPLVLYNSAYEPYWQDELNSYYAARYIMAHGIPGFPSDFIYPKAELFSYLLALVMTIFGTNNPVVTRSISMVLFLVSLPIFYTVGMKLFNRRVAWLAMIMLAFSPYAMEWSRQARMYELAQFMVIIVVGVLHWAIQNRDKTRPICIAILCILIAYFSHEELFVIFPALVICSLIGSREGPYGFPSILKKKHWWIPVLIALAIISTQLSIVILSHPPVLGTDQSNRPQIQITTDNIPYYFALLFEKQALSDSQPLLIVNSVLAVLGCLIAFQRKDRRARYCALFLLISTATLVFLFTMTDQRYYYPILPLYYLMAAYGTWTVLYTLWLFARSHLSLSYIKPRLSERWETPPSIADYILSLSLRLVLGTTVALVLTSIVLAPMLPLSNFNLFVNRALGLQYRRHFPDYDNVAQYMHDHMHPGDIVISVAPAVIILYDVGKVDAYFSVDHSLFLIEKNGHLVETSSGSRPLFNEAEFQNVLAEHKRIWLITDRGSKQDIITKNGNFVFPPPDFNLVYEGYNSGVYFRSSTW
jgi:4-amino-4-deoxy-L-arabinose transferase-like glycosyltransferase